MMLFRPNRYKCKLGLFQQLRSFTFHHVEVSEVFSLEPETFELPVVGSSEETATITPPCAHTGPAPVNVRLISHVIREGMVSGLLYYVA